MDLLTHGFLPYALFTWLRKPRSWRAAAAVGGMAPDMDVLWAWASHTHEHAYPLVHRGFSHTMLGAPLLATLLFLVLSRPALHKRFGRMTVFRWSAELITPLWCGALLHLVFDSLTITGVPMLWPLDDSKFTTNWFFFGVWYLLPLSFYGLLQIVRGKATERQVKGLSLALVALLLVAGCIRIVSYPRDLQGGETITPGPNDWTWYVSRRNETGVLVYGVGFLGERKESLFLAEPNRTQALAALDACRARPGHTPWEWDLWGLEVVNATRTADGWDLRFVDSAQVYAEDREPRLRPRLPVNDETDEGAFCHVPDGGQARFERPRGWFGS